MRPDPYNPQDFRPFGTDAELFGAPPAASGRGTKLIVVVAAMFGCGVLLCAGLGTVFYVAVQRSVSSQTTLPIERRPDTSAQDRADFNDALAHRLADQPVGDKEVLAWIERSLANLEPGADEVEVPVSPELFMRAVECSSQTRRLSLAARLQLKSSLGEAFPHSDALQHYTVLRIDTNPERNLATAHILFYDDVSQAFSVQWFLAKEQRRWVLYDWQRLEYGRRMSDEYASFFEWNSHPNVTGFDDTLAALGEIVHQRQSGEIAEDEALRRMKIEESRAMLPSDRSLGRLRIAWSYMAMEEYDEALRLLKTIPVSDVPWGVLPTQGLAHLRKEQNEEGLAFGEKMRAIAPNHPNARSIIAQALERAKQREDAKSHRMAIAALCPDDLSNFYPLLSLASSDDVPQLIRIAKSSKEPDNCLLRIIRHGEYSENLADNWDGYFEADVPENARQLAKAVASFRRGELEEAIQLYRALADQQPPSTENADPTTRDDFSEPADPFVAHAAQRYFALRIEAQQYAELLAESRSVERTLDRLVDEISEEDEDIDGVKLVAAIDSDPRASASPVADIIRGYAVRQQAIRNHDTGADAQLKAARHFDQFLTWAERHPDDLQRRSSGEWLSEWVNTQLVDCMLRSGQGAAAFQRWHDKDEIAEQIVNFYESNPETPGLAEVSEAVLAARPPDGGIAWLRLAAVERRLADEPVEADRLLLKAILREAESVGDDEEYPGFPWAVARYVRTRAERIVVDRLDAEIPANHPQLDSFWRRAANVAQDFRDSRAAAFLLASSQHVELDEDSRLAMHRMQARLAADAGDLDTAFTHWQAIHAATDAGWWLRSPALDEACTELLAAQRLAQAESLIAADADDSSDTDAIERRALLALAKGDSDGLIAALDSLELRQAGRWLISDAARPYLMANLDLAAKLVDRYPPYDGYGSVQGQCIAILRDSAAPLDADRVAGWARRMFNDSGTTTPITEDATNGDRSWIVSDGKGARLVIAFSTRRWDSYASSRPAVANALRDQASAISFAQLDGPAIPLHKLWEYARLALDDDAIAVYCQHASALWPATDDLKTRTEWSDRLPVGRDTLLGVYLSAAEADGFLSPKESRTSKDWQTALAAGSVEVSFPFELPGTAETLVGELQKVDGDEAEIRLSAPSRAIPYLTAGTRMVTDISSIAEVLSGNGR